MELIEVLKRNKKLIFCVWIALLLVKSVIIFTPDSTKNVILHILNDEYLIGHVFPYLADILLAGVVIITVLVILRFASSDKRLDGVILRIFLCTIFMPYAFVAYTAILVVFKTQPFMFEAGLIFGVMMLLALVLMMHLDIKAAVSYVRRKQSIVAEGKKELKFTK